MANPITSTINHDLIPYFAGAVVLIPLDANKKPDYTKAVATKKNFLTSTQTSVTRTTETLANGNGQDKEFILDETYNLTVVGNTYDPTFHAAVAGRIESQPEDILLMDEFEFNLPEKATDEDTGVLKITFGEKKDHEVEPAADSDGNYNFVISDSYGNRMIPGDAPTTGVYHYDDIEKALEFDESYASQNIRVVYYYSEPEGYQVASDPILRQPEYRLEIYGYRMSASGGEIYPMTIVMERASVTGDVTEQSTQKSKTAPITYTFASTPVPTGVSAYVEKYGPATTSQAS